MLDERLTTWNGQVLADDMGVGKTAQAILLAMLCFRGRRVLFVVPDCVVIKWETELARWAPGRLVFVALSSGRGGRQTPELAVRSFLEEANSAAWLVISYTQCVLTRALFLRSPSPIALAVFDEAHTLCNRSQRRSALILFRTGKRLLLTGTPVCNRYEDVWHLLDFAHPGVAGYLPWWRRFVSNPLTHPSQHDGCQVRAAELVMAQYAEHFVIRRERLAGSLEVHSYVIVCEASPYQLRLAEHVSARLKEGAYQSALMALHVMVRLSAHPDLLGVRSSPHATWRGSVEPLVVEALGVDGDPQGASPKFAVILDAILGVMDTTMDKLVVVSAHVEILEFIQACLNDEMQQACREWTCALYAGARGDNGTLATFQDTTSDLRLLLLSTSKGGVGIDLFAARHVYVVDPSMSPASDDQAVCRVVRRGQLQPVTVVRFVTKHLADERVLRWQRGWKKQLIQALADRTRQPVDSRISDAPLAECVRAPSDRPPSDDHLLGQLLCASTDDARPAAVAFAAHGDSVMPALSRTHLGTLVTAVYRLPEDERVQILPSVAHCSA